MPDSRSTILWFLLPALTFIDLVTKFWARTTLVPSTMEIDMGQFLALHLIQNGGVSFGALDFGGGMGSLVPILITIGLSGVVAVWLVRERGHLRRLFIGLILAGAVANIIDRIANGGVTDFIEYRWLGNALFVGNLADVWITIGAVGAFGGVLWAGLKPRRAVDVAQGERN